MNTKTISHCIKTLHCAISLISLEVNKWDSTTKFIYSFETDVIYDQNKKPQDMRSGKRHRFVIIIPQLFPINDTLLNLIKPNQLIVLT